MEIWKQKDFSFLQEIKDFKKINNWILHKDCYYLIIDVNLNNCLKFKIIKSCDITV
jgi:hypothetical protein